MGCLNGKLHRLDTAEGSNPSGVQNSNRKFKNGEDSSTNSTPETSAINGKKNVKKSRIFRKSTSEEESLDPSKPFGEENSRLSSGGTTSLNGGGYAGIFSRRFMGFSKSGDGGVSGSNAGHHQNGSILYSLGTLLENGARSSASPKIALGQQRLSEQGNSEDSPLTPDRLHKNFQGRLLTSQVSRNSQRLTDSQLEFFRMLDDKIAQGREHETAMENH